jgi:hypothetical protein
MPLLAGPAPKPFGLRTPAQADFIQLSKIRPDERLIGEESLPQKVMECYREHANRLAANELKGSHRQTI